MTPAFIVSTPLFAGCRSILSSNCSPDIRDRRSPSRAVSRKPFLGQSFLGSTSRFEGRHVTHERSLYTLCRARTPILEDFVRAVKQDSDTANSDSTNPDFVMNMFPDLETKRMVFVWNGETGAYAETALRLRYGSGTEAVPVENFQAAFEAVAEEMASLALIPIENSMQGSFYSNYDLLLKYKDLNIVEEIAYDVDYCLAALPGITLEDVRTIIGHPSALKQCEQSLAKFGKSTEPSPYVMGYAKRLVTVQERHVAAIVNPRTAEDYGLQILAKGLQDFRSTTRFLVISRTPSNPRPERPVKTSIVFGLQSGPGTLFKALSAFALRDINLTKIESRPIGEKFEFAFYIDLEADISEKRCQNALRHLEEEIATW
eukprot:CAMPEP_0184662068 /NCGR_PEP_ID=MMETSP0308-20130426/41396_1 /TAXON_ID=38269 /ORGANISM="Gloeochaete witrockiana, Strain SAG 46.84" /LENGTH=372 /DNA_ID=CAMNT_0027103801 /DNA_START=151 /DNA_END=1266 /DNA_ORIENTATION=-